LGWLPGSLRGLRKKNFCVSFTDVNETEDLKKAYRDLIKSRSANVESEKPKNKFLKPNLWVSQFLERHIFFNELIKR